MYLVDTHVLLWILDGGGRLGSRTEAALTAAPATHVSSISLLEITIRSMTGRLDLPADLATQVVAQGLSLLSFTAADAVGLTRFPELARHDPFDRALLSQAQIQGLRFLTADRVLLGLGLSWVEDARH